MIVRKVYLLSPSLGIVLRLGWLTGRQHGNYKPCHRETGQLLWHAVKFSGQHVIGCGEGAWPEFDLGDNYSGKASIFEIWVIAVAGLVEIINSHSCWVGLLIFE